MQISGSLVTVGSSSPARYKGSKRPKRHFSCILNKLPKILELNIVENIQKWPDNQNKLINNIVQTHFKIQLH